MIYAVLDQRPTKRVRLESSDPFNKKSVESSRWICVHNVVLDLIRDTGTIQHTPPKPLAEVKGTIHQILEQYRPAMRTFVTEAGRKPILPLWIPDKGSSSFKDHIIKLEIPKVMDLPSLILHDLDSTESVIGQKQPEHIDEIFTCDYHTCVDDYNFLHVVD